jgi:two-component system chemotaxis sensor kinase CheA
MTNSDEEIIAAAREGFLEEANDMLAQLEAALLVMEDDPGDAENLNAAFRAAHTIKGTAGLFGCDAVVSFTHHAETLMEALRAGQLAVSEAVIAALLQSRDQIAALLDEVRTGHRDAEVAARSEALGQLLHGLISNTPIDVAVTRFHALTEGGEYGLFEDDTPLLPIAGTAPSSWRISLRFGLDALRNGLDPLSFIRYLSKVGQVIKLQLIDERVPFLDQMDAEGCYLGFEIELDSDKSFEEIHGVFEFVLEDCEVHITRPAAAVAVAENRAVPAAAPAALASSAVPAAVAASKDRRSGGGEEARFIRVRADKLDTLIDLIGELVIASSGAQIIAQRESSPAFMEAALRIRDLVESARDGTLSLRMVPIGETFARFQRVVRDVSKQLGKDVELDITGGDTELDKSMVESIADPLMHLVRNSLDHGIETSADREAKGKSPIGHLALNAYHETGQIVIEVSDDGRGLSRNKIFGKAVEKGLIDPAAQLSDSEVHQLICLPGFSTAEKVTDISGRGVGMDVVRRNIDALRGQMQIVSTEGLGTTIQIRLPLTLAIIDGFLCTVDSVHYVVPLELVAECIEMPQACKSTHQIAGYFDLRGEVLPYLDMRAYLDKSAPSTGRQSMIVVRTAQTRVGLLVDRLLGEYQTVIKPLGQLFKNLRGLAGSTILGSGEVALILDIPTLVHQATARLSAAKHNNPSVPAAANPNANANAHAHAIARASPHPH